MSAVYDVGSMSVRIFIPSRRSDGPVLDRDRRNDWTGRAIAELNKPPFGGSTPTDVVGSFVHQDGRVTRETITILSSSCPRVILADEAAKERVLNFAKLLCEALGQESIFIGWGDQSFCVTKSFRLADVPVTRFDAVPIDERPRLITLGWGGIDVPEKMIQVLSLDGWRIPEADAVDPQPGLSRIAILDEPTGMRTAWHWKPPSGATSFEQSYRAMRRGPLGPSEGDLVFFQEDSTTISFGLCTTSTMVGPRVLKLSHGSLTPVTREMLGALLRRDWEALAELLSQKPLEKRFFPDLRALQEAVERDILSSASMSRKQRRGSARPERRKAELESAEQSESRERAAFRHSVLLVGRMMFLRFLVEKGWFPGGLDGLEEGFKRYGRRFYKEYLLPLWFDVFNVDPEKRSETARARFSGFPYLNGGLFQQRGVEATFSIAPERFDPAAPQSFLSLFRNYQFSLNEYGGSDETLRIDPSFFGKALESFNSNADRKADGVHYTPKPIALALAVEGVVERLHCLTGVDRGRIEPLLRDEVSLTPGEAARVLKALRGLRIIDPAVGSGVLLWACLEVLMTLDCACEGILNGGARYERGSFRWGRQCRYYVCNSLFGVDVSEEAVELARLRLWLAVAMSENAPALLPDLELNIVRGDSLREASPATAVMGEAQMSLGLDERTELKNQLTRLAVRYGRKGEDEPHAQRLILDDIRELRQKLQQLGEVDTTQEVSFDWELSFPQVFGGDGGDDGGVPKRGFDLVIANPPYVRVKHLKNKQEYAATWETIRDGSADLSFAFVELGLKRLAAPNGGQLAFIQPNFRHLDAGARLRRMLVSGEGGVRLRLWVDFDDEQVFDTATNYVALMFASRQEHASAPLSFQYSNPNVEGSGAANARGVRGTGSWRGASELGDIRWLRPAHGTHEHEPVDEWLTLPPALVRRVRAAAAGTTRRLGAIAEIDVGLQTSADSIFLFGEPTPQRGKVWEVSSKALGKAVRLERGLLRRCVKGASSREYFLLFPYDRTGQLYSERTLEQKFPMAWEYLCENKAALEGREKGKFEGVGWYRYGRQQGFVATVSPKLVVPALLRDPTVVHVDEKGELAFTASGKGGGGAWAIRPKVGSGVELSQLAEMLTSASVWDYVRVYGSPQQGGWRGVDRDVLSKLPV